MKSEDVQYWTETNKNDKQLKDKADLHSAESTAKITENIKRLKEGSKSDAIAYQKAEMDRLANRSDKTPYVSVKDRINKINAGVDAINQKPVLDGMKNYTPSESIVNYVTGWGNNSEIIIWEEGMHRDYLHAKNAGKYFMEVAGVYQRLNGNEDLSNLLFEALFNAKNNSKVSGLIEKKLESMEGLTSDEALILNTYVLGSMLDNAGYSKTDALESIVMPNGVKIEGKFYPMNPVFNGMDKEEIIKVLKVNEFNLARLIRDEHASVGPYVLNDTGAYSNYIAAATALITASGSRPSTIKDLKVIYENAKNVAEKLQ